MALMRGHREWTILVERTQAPLASQAVMAQAWLARMVGLVGRPTLPEGDALVLPGCRSIHTVGMRFPIDAVFVDRGWRVVALRTRVSPGRIVWPIRGAWGVVEVASGSVERGGIRVGDQLLLTGTLA